METESISLTLGDIRERQRNAKPTLTQIAFRPRVFYIRNIMLPEEAEAIIRHAAPSLQRSRTAGGPQNGFGEVNPVRTSNGMFMVTPEQRSLIAPLTERVSQITGIPSQNFEALQVLRYKSGERYLTHPDFFSGAILEAQKTRGGNRQATIAMFLNTVTRGGRTHFPLLNVSVPPKQGDGVLFWSMNEDGSLEVGSHHAGTAPRDGEEKWLAVYWMRERQFR